MSRRQIGIVMNGVTGRMGTNQHLVRSILAIRDQGGLDLGDGDVLVARADPGGSQRGRAARARRARTASSAGRPTSTRRWPIPSHEIYFDALIDVGAGAGGARRRSPRASTSTARSRPPRPSRTPSTLARAAPTPRASRTASCRTSSTCRAAEARARSSTRGFFGRILSVRGEFGYWVFEGDWQPGAAPVVELPRRGRRRHHRRHVRRTGTTCSTTCSGAVRAVSCTGVNAHPRALGRARRAPTAADRRRRRLRRSSSSRAA